MILPSKDPWKLQSQHTAFPSNSITREYSPLYARKCDCHHRLQVSHRNRHRINPLEYEHTRTHTLAKEKWRTKNCEKVHCCNLLRIRSALFGTALSNSGWHNFRADMFYQYNLHSSRIRKNLRDNFTLAKFHDIVVCENVSGWNLTESMPRFSRYVSLLCCTDNSERCAQPVVQGDFSLSQPWKG